MVAVVKPEMTNPRGYDCGLGQLLDGEQRLQSILPDVLDHLADPELKQLVRRTIRQSERSQQKVEGLFLRLGEPARREICRSTLTVARMLLDAAIRLAADEDTPETFVRTLRRLHQVRLSEYCVTQSLLGCAGLDDEVQVLQQCIEELHQARDLLTPQNAASTARLIKPHRMRMKPR